MKENIYIDLDEDIQSVIQRVQESQADDLELVVPTGARVFQNIVDAHLIREAGEMAGRGLTIVTSDLMGKIFAQKAGLAVSGQIYSDEDETIATAAVSRGRISDIVPKRRVGALADRKAAKPKTLISKNASSARGVLKKAGDNFKAKGEMGAGFLRSYREARTNTGAFGELRRINRKGLAWPFRFGVGVWLGAAAALSLAVVFLVFGRTLPKAEVVVYPTRELLGENINVLVSSESAKADLDKGVIPGELLTLEKTESGVFAASGVKDVSEKARGTITVYNAYSSQAQNFVPSRFQTKEGKTFWTVSAITVPGAIIKDGETTPGRVEAEAAAAEPGEDYNIGPARFTMPALKNSPKGEKIYAVSTSPMSGGKVGRSTVVSSDDADKAYNELKAMVLPQLAELKKNLPSGFQMWTEAYNEELADSSAEPDVGSSAEKFTAKVKMVARAVVFRAVDLETYANKELSSKLASGKTLLAGSKEISFTRQPVVDYQKGAIQAVLNIKYDVADDLDLSAFKNSILKKKEKDAKKVLANYGNIERVEVKLWPFWARSIPANPERVSIRIYGM